METFISSSSPIFTYSPCKFCPSSSGFRSGEEFFGVVANGSDTGLVTNSTAATSISFFFTGTGVNLSLSSSSLSLSTTFLVNSTAPPAGSYTNTSLTGLSLGEHNISVTLNPGTSATDWIRFDGMTGSLGTMITAQTRNETVDDTAWRSGQVVLTPAWNMLEQVASNWINTTQFDAELPTAARDYNSSISWTEEVGAGNSISFNGSAVWVYGIVGGGAGAYEVLLDDISRGIYNASGGSRVYQQVLYHTSNLEETAHNLTWRNTGGRLSFDYLVSTQNVLTLPPTSLPSPSPSATPSPSSTSVPKASSPPSSGIARGTIIGVSIVGSLVFLLLAIFGILFLLRRRNASKPTATFWRWSTPPKSKTQIRPFVPLMDSSLALGAHVEKLPAQKMKYQSNPFNTLFPDPVPEPSLSFMKFTRTPPKVSRKREREKGKEGEKEEPAPKLLFADTAPKMSPALQAALNGQTDSPLAQISSYFPDLHSAGAGGQDDMPSIHTARLSQDEEDGGPDRPETFGILSAYGIERDHEGVPRIPDAAPSPRRRFFGKVRGEGECPSPPSS
ncbi:hypothetical protein P7C73_g4321, partial [Tremellales sp. Uapishka_1]